MAIFLAGKAVCYRILAFFCYGKLHFKCESADLWAFFLSKIKCIKNPQPKLRVNLGQFYEEYYHS